MTGADRRDSPRGDRQVTPAREPLPFRPPLPDSVNGLAPFPEAATAILAAGLTQLRLDLDDAARTALVDHARLLLVWTEHVNLTAIRDPDRVAREHILDSLAAAPLLRANGVTRLLDLGSGGGYPGIPLAIALPGSDVTLVESIAKKARFLETAVRALGLGERVRVVNARAESLRSEDGAGVAVSAVCVRAVADLGILAGLASPLLAPGGWLLAWKRGDVAAEIAAAAGAIDASGFGRPEVHAVGLEGLEDHRLVVMTLVRPAIRHPRRPSGQRRRRW